MSKLSTRPAFAGTEIQDTDEFWINVDNGDTTFTSKKISGLLLKSLLISDPVVQNVVFIDQNTPTTGGVIFDPNTPATIDLLYVSSTNGSTWIWNGTAYVTYSVPVTNSTEFVLNGTTIDAGGNKTAAISRSGTVFIKNATTGVFSAIWDNQFNCAGLSGEQTSLRSRMLLITSNEGFLISGATFSNLANGFHRFQRKRGTVYSPTNTLSGDILGSIQSNGGWSGGTDIEFRATEEHSSLTNSGAEIVFKTKTNATVGTTPTDRVKIKNNGKFSIEGETASTLAGFNASKEVESLSTATYPSLIELSYVKGLTAPVGTLATQSGTFSGTSSGTNTGDQDLSSYATDSSVVKLTGNQSVGGIKTFTSELKLNDKLYLSETASPAATTGYTTLTSNGNQLVIQNGSSTAAATFVFNGAKIYTLPSVTGTLALISDLNARVQSVTSSATVTPVSTNDLVIITDQAVGLTLANPTGTFTEGQALMIRIKDNGTSQTIAFDTNYRAIGVTLPTTTVISKTIYLGIIYNSTDSKWDVVGYNIQA